MADLGAISCLVCGESCVSQGKDFVNKPTKKGLLKILAAAAKRKDASSRRILPAKASILQTSNFTWHVAVPTSATPI
jgi:hypothetical protein